MSETAPRPVLARIVAAHQGMGDGGPDPTADLQSGLSRAIRMASIPFEGLFARPAEVQVSRGTTLSDSMEALPETGLLAAIEDHEGRRGLVALSHPLVDALIEIQTTGRVEEVELPARNVTRIDEALCRDFLDLLFVAFAKETAKAAGRDWPDRITYGSRVKDRGQLNLLLPERGYHRLKVDVTVGQDRSGQIVLVLPRDPGMARRRAAGAKAPAKERPQDWATQVLMALGPAPLTLNAVLMRVTLPLGQVEAMEEGELIPFDPSDLRSVTLEGDGDHVFARGSLGQLGGKRAVRLGPPDDVGRGAAAQGTRIPASAAPSNAALNDAAAPAMADVPAARSPDPMAAAGNPAPDAMQSGVDPDAPMGDGLLPEAAGLPDLPMAGFDPNAPIG